MIGDEIKLLLQNIEDNGYHYCIYGGRSLPMRIDGSDIDILIDKIDGNLISLLINHGFVISRGVQIFIGTKIVACKFTKEYGWIPLHIKTPESKNFKIAPQNFHEYRNFKDNFYFAKEELEFVIITLISIKSGKITHKRTEKIKKWLHSINKDLIMKIVSETDISLIKIFERNVTDNFDFNSLLKDYKNLMKRSYLSRFVKKLFYKEKDIRPKRKGIIVSLEGIDGSGKSTFAHTINKFVNKENRTLFIESSMAGRGYSSWVRKVRRKWRKSCDRNGIYASFLKNSMIFIVLFLEILNSYFLYFKAKIKAQKGYNILFDRYSYLHYIRQSVHNKADFITKRLYIKLLYFFLIKTFPQPDIIIYFETDVNLAKSRKIEEKIEDLTQKKYIYNLIIKKIKKRTTIYEVDSSRPTEEIAKDFLNNYWRIIV